MPKYAMVVDLDRCQGCRACMVSCKVENNTTQGTFWMHVARFEEGTYPNTRISFRPRPCMHCDNPACAKVCPVGARYKRSDGIVVTDWSRCIGCRYCEVACPYGVNYFNWQHPRDNYYLDWSDPSGHHKGVMEKCTFCVHRVEQGRDPACVANCPATALIFGDLEDPQSNVSTHLKEKPHQRLLEEVGTEPRVYYAGGELQGRAPHEIEPVKGRV